MAEERNDDVKVDRVDVLSIGELYDRVEAALAATFSRGRGLWVRGELQSISDRTGHCYMDLVDPDSTRDRQSPVLKVKCWRNTWAQVKSLLLEEGIELQPGMVVLIRGTVDFYRPRAEVGFILSEIDITALIGRLAAQRAALLKALDSEGLIERNRRLSLADVPLRVGLIASPGTEGYRDFIGQIEHSGFSFKISVVPVTVQGPEAPAALAAAIGQFDATPVDLIVLVRGGGSKADLAGYDAEVLARAIAGARYPVWTGIGHTGDESVADIVSHRSFITPTECGGELATLVQDWWRERVDAPATIVESRALEVLQSHTEARRVARRRLAGAARQVLRLQTERLGRQAETLMKGAPRQIDALSVGVANRAARLGPMVKGHLTRVEDRFGAYRRLLRAYDVDRQLARGYTLTMDADGKIVKSVVGLAVGEVVTTRFADGATTGTIDTVVPAGLGDGAREHESRR